MERVLPHLKGQKAIVLGLLMSRFIFASTLCCAMQFVCLAGFLLAEIDLNTRIFSFGVFLRLTVLQAGICGYGLLFIQWQYQKPQEVPYLMPKRLVPIALAFIAMNSCRMCLSQMSVKRSQNSITILSCAFAVCLILRRRKRELGDPINDLPVGRQNWFIVLQKEALRSLWQAIIEAPPLVIALVIMYWAIETGSFYSGIIATFADLRMMYTAMCLCVMLSFNLRMLRRINKTVTHLQLPLSFNIQYLLGYRPVAVHIAIAQEIKLRVFKLLLIPLRPDIEGLCHLRVPLFDVLNSNLYGLQLQAAKDFYEMVSCSSDTHLSELMKKRVAIGRPANWGALYETVRCMIEEFNQNLRKCVKSPDLIYPKITPRVPPKDMKHSLRQLGKEYKPNRPYFRPKPANEDTWVDNVENARLFVLKTMRRIFAPPIPPSQFHIRLRIELDAALPLAWALQGLTCTCLRTLLVDRGRTGPGRDFPHICLMLLDLHDVLTDPCFNRCQELLSYVLLQNATIRCLLKLRSALGPEFYGYLTDPEITRRFALI